MRLEALAQSDTAEVCMLADRDRNALCEAGAAAPQAATATSLDELLEAELDGVVIATPSALHAEQSLRALRRGVAVFCQKPLARTAPEARAVIDAARRADLPLGVDYCYRHLNGMAQMRELIRSGALGRIFNVELVFHNAYGPDKPWFRDLAQAGGGCLMDLGPHLLDLALWCLDGPPVERLDSRLFAAGERLTPPLAQVEDYAVLNIDLAGGARVNISCSWNLHAGCDVIIGARFYGSDGACVLRNVPGSYYDFVIERLTGTGRETLATYPDAWGGRALLAWTQRLAQRRGLRHRGRSRRSTGAARPRLRPGAGRAMMRVLMTADTLGGVWTYALALADGLCRRGVEVHLATMGRLPDEAQRAQAHAVDGLQLHASGFRLCWMQDPWDDLGRAGDWLTGLAARLRPDVVHLNDFGHAAIPWNAPVLLVAHSCVLSWWQAVHRAEPPAEWQRYRRLVQRGLQCADRVVAPSFAMAEALRKHYGTRPPLRVIPNGLTLPGNARPQRKAPLVLSRRTPVGPGEKHRRTDRGGGRSALAGDRRRRRRRGRRAAQREPHRIPRTGEAGAPLRTRRHLRASRALRTFRPGGAGSGRAPLPAGARRHSFAARSVGQRGAVRAAGRSRAAARGAARAHP